jgi:hypothetical protein
MAVTIDPNAYLIGACDVYYRALGGTGLWISVGATVDDVVFRLTQTMFNPSDEFNGILQRVKGMDYKSKEAAEAEVTMPEIAGAKFPLVVPGARVTANVAADTGGGFSTDLNGDVDAGATAIIVTSAAGIAVGDLAHIGTGATSEYRVIDAIAANTLTFRDPLLLDHADAEAVVEADNDGKTEIRGSLNRRLPDSSYNDWVLTPQSGSDWFELYLYNAVATQDTAELNFGNESMAAVKATIGSRWDGTPGTDSWLLRVPA